MALSVLFVSQVLVGASSAQKIRAGEGALGEERGESLRDTPALLCSGAPSKWAMPSLCQSALG